MVCKTSAALCALGLALAGLLVLGAPPPAKADWAKVDVTLPTSVKLFPPGEGADIANSQCLLCHSTSMVLFQPARTQAQWKDTINKMRTVYGAPLPAEQVDALAAYLSRVVAVESSGLGD